MKLINKCLLQLIIFLVFFTYCAYNSKSIFLYIVLGILFIILMLLIRIIFVDNEKNKKR